MKNNNLVLKTPSITFPKNTRNLQTLWLIVILLIIVDVLLQNSRKKVAILYQMIRNNYSLSEKFLVLIIRYKIWVTSLWFLTNKLMPCAYILLLLKHQNKILIKFRKYSTLFIKSQKVTCYEVQKIN